MTRRTSDASEDTRHIGAANGSATSQPAQPEGRAPRVAHAIRWHSSRAAGRVLSLRWPTARILGRVQLAAIRIRLRGAHALRPLSYTDADPFKLISINPADIVNQQLQRCDDPRVEAGHKDGF